VTMEDEPARPTRCPDCRAGLDHCHGTLIVHHDLVVECTDAGCTALERVRHALIIDCDEILPACGCGAGEASAG